MVVSTSKTFKFIVIFLSTIVILSNGSNKSYYESITRFFSLLNLIRFPEIDYYSRNYFSSSTVVNLWRHSFNMVSR